MFFYKYVSYYKDIYKISFSLQIYGKNGFKSIFKPKRRREGEREKDSRYFTREATTCIKRIGVIEN